MSMLPSPPQAGQPLPGSVRAEDPDGGSSLRPQQQIGVAEYGGVSGEHLQSQEEAIPQHRTFVVEDAAVSDEHLHSQDEATKGELQPGFQCPACCSRDILTRSDVWWRHPVARILMTWVILILDMYIYVEDPLNDSHVEYTSVAMGPILGLVSFWAAPTVGLAFLRLFILLASFVIAVVVGRKFIVKWLLRDKMQLSAFEGDGPFGCQEGTLCITFLMSCACWYLGSVFYSAVTVDQLDSLSNEIFLLFRPSKQFRHVNQCWQALSVLADILTILTVLDVCLQDRRHYGHWLPSLKRFWCESFGGWVRIGVTWVAIIGGASVATWGLFSSSKELDNAIVAPVILGGSSEITRSIVAAILIFTDLLVCVQDWDFPTFYEPLEIEAKTKVLGLFATEIRIAWLTRLLRLLPIPSCGLWKRLERYLPSLDDFTVKISGKWMQYGPLVCVMMIDLFYTYVQISYKPSDFGQYADAQDHFVWTITDQAMIDMAYSRGVLKNESLVSWAARRNLTTGEPLPLAIGDVKTNCRYTGSSAKYVGVVIGLLAILGFFCTLWFADWRHREKRRLSKTEPLEVLPEEKAHTEDPAQTERHEAVEEPAQTERDNANKESAQTLRIEAIDEPAAATPL